ncbi:DNA primase [Streptomyces sp. NPDC052012]|uniref:DNA primase n=1 Tax=Streptomyces sp. NPDC052012 TaxID=3155051 RepID=UPI00344CC550
MNRLGLGLAVGAGYLLGRTKKLKMAVAVGGLVAGKKLNLSPRMVAELVSQQLRDNPQFKELGDQLRGDLRGVGKAASGALVERQLDAVADRLHGRTAELRDRLAGGGLPGTGRNAQDTEDTEDAEGAEGAEEPEGREPEDEEAAERAEQRAPAKKSAAKKAAKKAPAKKAPTKKAPGRNAAATKKAAARKTTAAKKTAASRGSRSRSSKGGGE